MLKKVFNFYKLLQEKKYTTLAGGISFFLILNGGSFLFVYFILTSNMNISTNFVNNFLIPEEVKTVVSMFLVNTSINLSGSIFILLTSIWSASNLFYHIIKSGEIIYGIKRKRGRLFTRAISVILLLLFLVMLFLTVLLMSFLQYIVSFLKIGLISRILKYLIVIIIPFILLLFINVYIPPIKIKIREVIYGSLFSSFYWFISTFIFIYFLKYFSNIKSFYGNLAIIIIFMLWIYIIINGMIIGFIINYHLKNNNKTILYGKYIVEEVMN